MLIVPVYEVVNHEKVVSILNNHYNEVSDIKKAGYQFNIPPSVTIKDKYLLISPTLEYGDYYLVKHLKDKEWVRLKYFIDYNSMKVISLNSQLGGLLSRVLRLIEEKIMVPRVTIKASLDTSPSYARNLNQRTKPVVVGFDVRGIHDKYLVFNVLLASTVPHNYLKPAEVDDDVVRLPVSEVQEYPHKLLIKTRSGGLVLLWTHYGSQVFEKLFIDVLSLLHYKRDKLLSFRELAGKLNIIWNRVRFSTWGKLYSLTPLFSELTEKTPAVLSFNKRGEATLSVKGVSVNVDKLHNQTKFYKEFLLTPSNKITKIILEVLGLSECKVENTVVYNTPSGGVPLYFELSGGNKVFMHPDLLNLLVFSEFYKLIKGETGDFILLDAGVSVKKRDPVLKEYFKFKVLRREEVFHQVAGLVKRFWLESLNGVKVLGSARSVIYYVEK